MKHGLVLLVVLITLAGCENLGDSYPGGGSYRVPPGTVLSLNSALPVARNSTRVSVQNGRAGRIRQFQPFCRFELATLDESARTIEPGDYTITRSVLERGYFARNGDRFQLASVRIGRGGDQPSHITFATHFYTGEGGPSDLFRVSCARLGDWHEAAYVTVEEAQATLGSLARFKLPLQRE